MRELFRLLLQPLLLRLPVAKNVLVGSGHGASSHRSSAARLAIDRDLSCAPPARTRLDVEGILAFAGRVLPRAADLRVQASLEQRQRFQQLLFLDGISFDGN